jgi:hypothetical protein
MRIEERDDIGLKKRVPVNLEKRDVVGDGPLTVTVTPAASVSKDSFLAATVLNMLSSAKRDSIRKFVLPNKCFTKPCLYI